MKLLIITQKVDVNDDVLGFMHAWLGEFAKNCEKLTVICLQKGQYHLPGNVKVLSLGKEAISQKPKAYKVKRKLLYAANFYKYLWQERKNYDYVFVHMNQIYVILGALLWKMRPKKIGLWYAHGQVSFSLKLAEKLADVIFTSTKSGCRINSKKIRVIGQGIDISKFEAISRRHEGNEFNIITVGRISPVKNYETLIRAIDVLSKENIKVDVNIVGGAGMPDQEEYLADLKKLVKEKKLENSIHFKGAVANKNIVRHLQTADLFVSAGLTGSLDKAMAEAMSCGLPLITCNEAMLEVLGDYKDKLMYDKQDYKGLSGKIKMIISMDKHKRQKIGQDLRAIIVNGHGLENFVQKILNNLCKNY